MSLTPPKYIRRLRELDLRHPTENGTLHAVLACRCGETAKFVLYSDGYYLQIAGNVYANEGDWVVRAGTKIDGSDTVIRCPEHRFEVIPEPHVYTKEE